uniref:Uncharacterized protein n=1 Tax=Arion vulgaris TaxID=1028688 RepID=A0A0B7AFP1_9EUPU
MHMEKKSVALLWIEHRSNSWETRSNLFGQTLLNNAKVDSKNTTLSSDTGMINPVVTSNQRLNKLWSNVH